MKTIKYFIILTLTVIIQSCDDEAITPQIDEFPVLVFSGKIEGAEINASVYSKDSLKAGHQEFKITLKNGNNQPVRQAEVELAPTMHMMSMNHGAPMPKSTKEDSEGNYYRNIIFTMPGNQSEYWELNLTVTDPDSGSSGTLSTRIDVKNPNRPVVKVLTGLDNQKYIIALVEPKKPRVGINDFHVAVFKKETGHHFPAVEGLDITIEPEMPSMGHGSPNNVNPVHQVNGYYKGKVNFTMNGLWKINLHLKEGESEIVQTYFDIEF